MPGADAVRAAFDAPALLLEPGLELELEPELHAATASAAAIATAMAGTRSRCDLFIECLLSHEVPGGRPPGLAEPGPGWPTRRRPQARHPAWTPWVTCGQGKSRKGREA